VPDLEVDEWVVSTQQGDAESFCAIAETLEPVVRRFVAARCYCGHVVDDLVQNVFIYAYEHIAEYQAGTDFRAWLLAIARITLLGKFRADQRRSAAHQRYAENVLVTHAIDTLDDETRDLRMDALEICLSKLGKDAGELIRLRYQSDMSLDEIGSMLNRSLSWAKTSLFRVKKTLWDCMQRRLAVES
jgi:RNA polymerase sigma-70 factor (ECF subfamily)